MVRGNPLVVSKPFFGVPFLNTHGGVWQKSYSGVFYKKISYSEGDNEHLPRKKNHLIKLKNNREGKANIYIFASLGTRSPVRRVFYYPQRFFIKNRINTARNFHICYFALF